MSVVPIRPQARLQHEINKLRSHIATTVRLANQVASTSEAVQIAVVRAFFAKAEAKELCDR